MTDWPQGVAVEVWVQDPGADVFRLDVSALDVGRFRPLDPAALILDQGRLDTGTLGTAPPPWLWWDITGPSTHIDASCGLRSDSPLREPEVGTLTVSVADMPALSAIGLHPGVSIRVRHGDLPLWVGSVDDVAVTWQRDGTSATTITASDWVGAASRTTRYGAEIPEPCQARAVRVLEESLPVPLTVAVAGSWTSPEAAPVLSEMSILDHLAMAAATGRFLVVPRPALDQGHATIIPTDAPSSDGPTLSDVAEPSFSELVVSAGSSQIVNLIEITNNFIDNSSGTPSAGSSTTTVENNASILSWGQRSINVDMCASTTDVLMQAASAIMSKTLRSVEQPSSVTVRGEDFVHVGPLHPFSPVVIEARGTRHTMLVATITHDITPTRWTVTMTLMRKDH